MEYLSDYTILKIYGQVETGNTDHLYLDPRVADFIRRVLAPFAQAFDQNPDHVVGIIERDFERELGQHAISEFNKNGLQFLMEYLIMELLEQGIQAMRNSGVQGMVPLIREDVIRGILKDGGLNETFNKYDVINEETIKQDYLVSLSQLTREGEDNHLIFYHQTVTVGTEEALAGLNAAMAHLSDEFDFWMETQDNGENQNMIISIPKIINNPRYLVQDINDQLETIDSVYVVKVGDRYYKFNTPYFMQGVFTASNWTGVPREEIYSDLRRVDDGSEVIME